VVSLLLLIGCRARAVPVEKPHRQTETTAESSPGLEGSNACAIQHWRNEGAIRETGMRYLQTGVVQR
jgi:hypothetical protein